MTKTKGGYRSNRNLNGSLSCLLCSALAVTLCNGILETDAFTFYAPYTSTRLMTRPCRSTSLYMGGFNKRKKQADFLKKVKEKKLSDLTEDELTPEQIKERNDRRRFDDLLNSESATYRQMSELGGGTYLTSAQEEEEMNASFSRVERLYEGDPAPILPFEDLVNVKSDNAVGKVGTERLLPWLKKGNTKEYVICVSDPREKSSEIRTLMKNLPHKLPGKKILFINSDATAETRRWAKKNEVKDINVFSDEKREWMRAYTALGDKRWSMCMFILVDGKVQRMIRDLDVDLAERAIANAINSLD